ncbi:tetratricopeptide repeat protein [Bizionia sp.]|uniref:tetratricopeptide repeat protein n=1 Tax=Bizionia sp. TaxID=1954480 RepID=UPI003A934CF1
MTVKQAYYVLVCVLFFSVHSVFAGDFQKKQVDSLLKANTNTVYDNPNASIEIGLSVYNDDTNSIKTKAKALMLVSLAYTSKRDYQKALEYTIKAEELSGQIKDPILNIEILFRTGILYQQLKIFDKSIKFLDQAEELCLAYPEKDSIGIFLGNTYIVKGFIYKDNLNCDIALGFFAKGISEYEMLKGTRQRTNMSIAYYNKGNCYSMLSQYDKAKESFHKSIELAKIENANSLISFAQKGLAEVYTLEGNYAEAIELLHIALIQSKNVGDIILNLGIYKGLFENYLALNQWDEYQKYYNLYLKTQLEIKESERSSISDSIDENYKTYSEKHTETKNHYYNNIKLIFIAGFIVILSIIFIEIKNQKQIKSLKNDIETIQNLKNTSK